MKIFFVSIIFSLYFIFPSSTFASHVQLSKCIEVAHCVREDWDVSEIEQPFNKIKEIIENAPRSVIVDFDRDYLHAEVTSKWMKYVDDLEVSFIPESSKLQVRSESRVGESDLGVNKKRIHLLKSKLFEII